MSSTSSSLAITIIGSGYTGVTSAAILANIGYTVYALEINPERLAAIKRGQSFFYEEHLDALLKKAIDDGRLIATNSYEEAIPKSDIIFSCVGTPDNSDGSTNLTHIFAAANETAAHAKPGTIYAQRSTVPVGTGAKIEKIFAEKSADIRYVSNPEFLREGTALIDSIWFSRAVVGGSDEAACQAVLDIHRRIVTERERLCSDFNLPRKSGDEPGYLATSLSSSELIKVSANAFLSLKISFANSIAKLADATESDIIEVMDGVGMDKRIGRDFLNAGRGYGGGCFPKDVSGLISSGLEHGVDLAIMQAVSTENESMPGYILEKAARRAGGSLAGKKVAVLGLAFKAGTSDVRKSPAIKIANLLIEKMDANVTAYDPHALKDGSRDGLHMQVTICDSKEQAMVNTDVVIIATDWPEFTKSPENTYAGVKPGGLIIDAMNCLDKRVIESLGLDYLGIGR